VDFVNAISKVRFSTSGPRCVQLHRSDSLVIEALCMEPGQEVKSASADRAYYVVTGSATVTCGGVSTIVPAGQMAVSAGAETHTVANSAEQRLVCLAVSRPS